MGDLVVNPTGHIHEAEDDQGGQGRVDEGRKANHNKEVAYVPDHN